MGNDEDWIQDDRERRTGVWRDYFSEHPAAPGELVLVRTILRSIEDGDRFSLGQLEEVDNMSVFIEQPGFALAAPISFGGREHALVYPSHNRVFYFADTRVMEFGREKIGSYLRNEIGWGATADWVDSLERPYVEEG